MKRNLQTLTCNFVLNTTKISKQIVITIFCFAFANANATTFNISLTNPATVSACMANSFSVKYFNDSAKLHTVQIHAELNNEHNTCSSTALRQMVFVVDSMSSNVTDIGYDSVSNKYSFQISATTDSVFIFYKLFIDCTIRDTSQLNQQSISLTQTFTDTTGINNFKVNSTLYNSFTITNIKAPRFIPSTLQQTQFTFNYLESNFLDFSYINKTDTSANIQFNFQLNDSTFCGAGKVISYKFKTGSGPFTTFNQYLFNNVVIGAQDTLFIRLEVTDTACLSGNCANSAILKWHCNSNTYFSSFCTSCLNEEIISFYIKETDAPVLKFVQLSPASNASDDFSCFNSSSQMVQWKFMFVHDSISIGAADSAVVLLSVYNTYLHPNYLTLIPQDSIRITRSSNSFGVDSLFTYPATTLLCTNYIANPIQGLQISLTDFKHGDTLWVEFKTFRCAEENDSLLLNQAKNLNQWAVTVTAYNICRNIAALSNAKFLSHDVHLGYANIDQQIQFFPSTNNLSVPSCQQFGDSLDLVIDLLGLQSPAFTSPSYQYLGCGYTDPYTPCNAPNGIVKVKFDFELGLRLSTTDSVVYFLIDTNNVQIKIYPDDFHTNVSPYNCEEGQAYFYFHLSDTLLYALNNGSFKSRIQACCIAQPVSDYQIAFYLMPNPDNCFSVTYHIADSLPPIISDTNQAFIPMTSTGQSMHVHCPGCKAPGTIVDRYSLRRMSFGLQDSNNNGIADSGFVAIGSDSTWMNNFEAKLLTNNSSFGDKLVEKVVGHFQNGSAIADSCGGPTIGYTYAMMKINNSILNYLQINSHIPASVDSLGLTPTDFTFYLDVPDTSNANCIDCNLFEVNNFFKTKLQIVVPQNMLQHYLVVDSSNNTFRYTFSFLDSANYYLKFNSVLQHYDSVDSVNTFEIEQRYRLLVHYNQCKPFAAPEGTLDFEQAMKRSEIISEMWLSGVRLTTEIDQMPNDTGELHAEHWTFNPSDTTKDLVNQQFANEHNFYCEFSGALHYFFSQQTVFSADYFNENPHPDAVYTCGVNMDAYSGSSIAYNLFDPYPFEYRPPSLHPYSFRFWVPQGYHKTVAYIRHELYFPTYNYTPWLPIDFTVSGANQFVTIPHDSLIDPHCLSETTMNNGTFASDSLLYVKDGMVIHKLRVKFMPDSCTGSIELRPDTMISCTVDTINLSCISNATCGYNIEIKSNVNTTTALTSSANLQAEYNPTITTANSSKLCWDVTLTNPKVPLDTINTTLVYPAAANHVFITVPQVSFLNNFTFTFPNGSIINSFAGQLIYISDTMFRDGTITGKLCANYIQCMDSTSFELLTGYDCFAYPDTPFISSNICYLLHDTLIIEDPFYEITSNHKTSPIDFSLCKPFYKTVEFSNNGDGLFYVDSVSFINAPAGFTILSAFISDCTNTSDTIQLASSTVFNHWLIDTTQVDSIGIKSGIFERADCIKILFLMQAGCIDTVSQYYDHDIELAGHKICGGFISRTETGSVLNYNDSNYCSDCFSITKSVDKDTALVGDTITYTITICSNNGSQQSIIVTDTMIMPTNFFITYTNLPAFAYNFPKDTCINYLLKGYFLTSDSCPNTTNTGILEMSNYSKIYSSVCNTIYPECYVDTMIFLPDSTLSSTLTATSNKTYYLVNTLVIDTNTTFTNCTLYVATGGSIIIMTGDTLTLDSSAIVGCGYMWQGIKLDTLAFINSMYSKIGDANAGIALKSSGGFKVADSKIVDCVKGIYAPPLECSDISYVTGSVEGTTFGLERPSFLPNYTGQPAHGVLPKAGIDVSDMIANFGNNSGNKNYFNKLNIGLIAYRSSIDLNNSVFRNISVDTNYTEDYGGTAIVSLGQESGCHQAGSLNVFQVPNGDTLAKNIYRGIYTRYSDLYVVKNKITNSTVGIYSNNTSDLRTAIVDSCYIEASFRGINWYENGGAALMRAFGDTIKITGDTLGIGIKLTGSGDDANYLIQNNDITITEGRDGINANSVLKPIIVLNKINQLTTGAKHPETNGILLNGCDSVQASCNRIYTNYANTISGSYGIKVSQTSNSIIQCNTTTNHNRGVFFGGANCIGTTFRGDSMVSNSIGLYLNNTAVIDSQTHAGNRWIGTFASGFGAKNFNDSALVTLQQSLFIVDPGLGGTYTPTIPTIHNGWFKPDTGSTYSCNSQSCEDQYFTGGGSEGLRMSIANGNAITSDFIAESSTIAEQYLFEGLKQDSSKYLGNNTLQSFVIANENTSIGFLYQAKKSLQSTVTLNDSIKTQLIATNNLLKTYSDSIRHIDNLAYFNPNTNYSSIRNQLVNQILSLQTNVRSLFQINKSNIESHLSDAEYNNSLVSAAEIPIVNDRFINQITIIYKLFGRDSVAFYFQQVVEIANQCPYKGGKAVYRARSLLTLFNDNLFYDDDYVCAQQGFYRLADEPFENIDSFQVKPNPASDIVDIVVNGNLSGVCSVKIKNSIGMEVLSTQFDCASKAHSINVQALSPGVYILQLNVSNQIVGATKVVIVR